MSSIQDYFPVLVTVWNSRVCALLDISETSSLSCCRTTHVYTHRYTWHYLTFHSIEPVLVSINIWYGKSRKNIKPVCIVQLKLSCTNKDIISEKMKCVQGGHVRYSKALNRCECTSPYSIYINLWEDYASFLDDRISSSERGFEYFFSDTLNCAFHS
jgi:hypothetical protein